ncbi:hypothetical protein TrispH2_001999 [Trichoplax sp. H2]|nr:hypothetical protein TrispH2_001999 [Trichoplax sp. H2]|eukprot:RDD46529.1 hypothetical protein TrispH2_001999 [Trichoplax sp. H2]
MSHMNEDNELTFNLSSLNNATILARLAN